VHEIPTLNPTVARCVLSYKQLQYTALSTGCTPSLQCLGQLSLLPSMGWYDYQLWAE